MHVIVSTRGSRRWISGVFVNAQEAHLCLAAIPVAEAVNHAIERVLSSQFPFFVLEDNLAFRFLDATEVTHVIESMATAFPNDTPILFAFLSEYHPDIPG